MPPSSVPQVHDQTLRACLMGTTQLVPTMVPRSRGGSKGSVKPHFQREACTEKCISSAPTRTPLALHSNACYYSNPSEPVRTSLPKILGPQLNCIPVTGCFSSLGSSSRTLTKLMGNMPSRSPMVPLIHSSFTHSVVVITSPSKKLSSPLASVWKSNRASHLPVGCCV